MVENAEKSSFIKGVDRGVYFVPFSSNISESELVPLTYYKNISKLKMMGWKLSIGTNRLYKNYCVYNIKDKDGKVQAGVLLTLKVDNSTGLCDITVDFSTVGNSNPIIFVPKYGFIMSYQNPARLFLHIPPEMTDYLLYLYAVKDFDGVMKAFSNILGSEISHIADGVDGVPELVEWV